MIIFFIILFFLIINKDNKNSGPFFMIVLILLSSLRSESVGADVERYVEVFNGGGHQEDIEGLFYLVTDSLRFLGISSQIYLAVMACMILIPVFYFIKSKSVATTFSILIYFCLTGDSGYVFTNSGIRQSIAVGLVLIAYLYMEKVENKKFTESVKYCILAFGIFALAFGFHSTSVMGLLIGTLAFFCNFRKKTWAFLFVFGFIFTFIISLDSILPLLNLVSIDLFSDATDKYNRVYEFYDDVRGPVAKFYTAYPITFIALFSIYKNMYKGYLERVFYIGSFLLLIFNGIPIVNRVFLYFTLIQIVLWPNCYKRLSNKKEKLIFNLGLLLFIVMFIYDNFHSYRLYEATHTITNSVPYEFFFEK